MQVYEVIAQEAPAEQEVISFDLAVCSFDIVNGRLMVRARNPEDKICMLCQRKKHRKAAHGKLLLDLEQIEQSIDEKEDADEIMRLWEKCEEIRRKMKWYDYYTDEEFEEHNYYRQLNEIYLHEKMVIESAYHI